MDSSCKTFFLGRNSIPPTSVVVRKLWFAPRYYVSTPLCLFPSRGDLSLSTERTDNDRHYVTAMDLLHVLGGSMMVECKVLFVWKHSLLLRHSLPDNDIRD